MIIQLLPYLNCKKIILGSASPRRYEALKGLGLKFEVIPSKFEENLDKTKFTSPVDYVKNTAFFKSVEIYNRLFKDVSLESDEMADLIICADTIVVLDDQILEKPQSKEHAVSMLSQLSGRKHLVHTSVSLVFPKVKDQNTNKYPWIHSFSATSEVEFSDLSMESIKAYVNTGIPMDKAGSYGIQEPVGGSFISKIDGCYYNVTGFPLNKFCSELSQILTDHKL